MSWTGAVNFAIALFLFGWAADESRNGDRWLAAWYRICACIVTVYALAELHIVVAL